MDLLRHVICLSLVTGLCVVMSGCNNKLLDPAQVGRFRPTPAVNIILDSLGVAEEEPDPWDIAEEPTPSDIIAGQSDTILGAGDIVRVSIYELYAEGQMFTKEYIVRESGHLVIPDVGGIQAAGLSETELEQEISSLLSPNILKNPSVTTTLMTSQRRMFSVVGDGILRPNRYFLPRHEFRLNDALALAGWTRQFNVSDIYVSRRLEEDIPSLSLRFKKSQRSRISDMTQQQSGISNPISSATVMPRRVPPAVTRGDSAIIERRRLGMATPTMQRLWQESEKILSSQNWSHRAIQGQIISPSEFASAASENTLNQLSPPTNNVLEEPQSVEWVFEDGKWKPIVISSQSLPAAADPLIKQDNPNPPGSDDAALRPRHNNFNAPSLSQRQTTSLLDRVRDKKAITDRTSLSGSTSQATDMSTVQSDWVFKDGRWVPMAAPDQADSSIPSLPLGHDKSMRPLDPPRIMNEDDLDWEQAMQSRLIRIPADKLQAGDPRYNIVIKPGDTIHVPVKMLGECYVSGHVNRTGIVNLTGRPMTLKMVIAAAGGLSPLAYPKYCEVIRRLDDNREEIVMVDLEKIYSGEQPDFYIKPNDQINVGTHYTSRWRAVLRNAFRMAYGFAFVYDRNFADEDYGKDLW